MSEERKGINLFEVNGVQYRDNLPNNSWIGITKEQYCEYLQLQQENQRLNNTNIQLSTLNTNLRSTRDNYKSVLDEIREYIENDQSFIYGIRQPNGEFVWKDTANKEDMIAILDKVKEWN